MANHVHIHLHRATKDNVAHDPSNGQFTSGSGGGYKKGDHVKLHESYGGLTGRVESANKGFVVVKHSNGTKTSLHESLVKLHSGPSVNGPRKENEEAAYKREIKAERVNSKKG